VHDAVESSAAVSHRPQLPGETSVQHGIALPMTEVETIRVGQSRQTALGDQGVKVHPALAHPAVAQLVILG
jgi:hypothetical protein